MKLKFLESAKFAKLFQFIECIYLHLVLLFMLIYSNEAKHINEDLPRAGLSLAPQEKNPARKTFLSCS